MIGKVLNFYICYFESANYCGYGEHYVVKAEDSDEAEQLTSEAAEEFYYEQDSDILEGEDDQSPLEGPYATLVESYAMNSELSNETLNILCKPNLGNSYTHINCSVKEVNEYAKQLLLIKAI